MTLDCTRIAKDFMMVSEFLSNEGGTQTLASDKNKKDHKHLRSKRLKPVVDYCQKQNDHKQRIFKHKTKKKRTEIVQSRITDYDLLNSSK